ncbi:MAG: YceI family protein [Cyclobacteriaceae bacterium]
MRLKIIFLIIVVAISKIAVAQNALIDKEGVAHFFSEAPLEDIEAINKKALGAIDLEKGTVAVSMVMKDFHFDKSLMEEHFNENYIESEKYPKASFKGKILDFASLDFTHPGEFTAKAEGELEIHGVSKPLTSDVEFRVTEDKIEVSTFFQVALEDHKIKIPKIVIKNIAEVVDVDTKFNFIKK